MAISAKDVMALRKKTGLGMMDCKKALTETDGDFDKAIELLREKLQGKMDERSDRETAEGVIAVAVGDAAIAMIELDSETDFVARNEDFVATASKIAEEALKAEDGTGISSDTITGLIDESRITTKENVNMRQSVKLSGESFGSYVHHNKKVGVILVAEGDLPADLGTGICQHIAASVPAPLGVDKDSLPAEEVEKHRQAAIAEAEASGKPKEIAEKIATGKLNKWVNENTLLGQVYLREMDAKKPVSAYVPEGVKLVKFVKFAVAED